MIATCEEDRTLNRCRVQRTFSFNVFVIITVNNLHYEIYDVKDCSAPLYTFKVFCYHQMNLAPAYSTPQAY